LGAVTLGGRHRRPTDERTAVTIDLRRADGDRPLLPAALMAVAAVVFVVLAILGLTTRQPLLDLDQPVPERAYDVTDGRPWLIGLLDVTAIVTSNWTVGVVLALVAGLLWWRSERLLAAWVVASTVVVLGGNALIKLVVQRERPVWDEPLHEIGGYSFPSGHSAGAGLFFTVLALLTIVLTGRGLRRRLLLTLWIVLALLTAPDRVFLGVHSLSDVTAGLCFGGLVPLLLWRVIVSGSEREPAETAVLTGSGRR